MAARILLGSTPSQVGWLILGLGSVFFWTAAWNADVSGWRFRAAHIGHARGAMLDCTETRFSEGGSKSHRGIRIYENRYRYAVAGQAYEGTSFVVGQCIGGAAIPVEYLLAKPAMSRIAGMRRAPLSAWA